MLEAVIQKEQEEESPKRKVIKANFEFSPETDTGIESSADLANSYNSADQRKVETVFEENGQEDEKPKRRLIAANLADFDTTGGSDSLADYTSEFDSSYAQLYSTAAVDKSLGSLATAVDSSLLSFSRVKNRLLFKYA